MFSPRAVLHPPLLPAVLILAGVALACTGAPATSRTPDKSASRAASSPSAQAITTAGTQQVVLAVKGMYCASCEQTVVTMLRRTAGVMKADVSVERGEATVSYDSTRTSPAQLVQVVKTLGYEASVKRT